MFENVDGRKDDGVTGILIAHLGAFRLGELIINSYEMITLVKPRLYAQFAPLCKIAPWSKFATPDVAFICQ